MAVATTTLVVAGIVATALAAGVSAYGMSQQADAQEKASRYQAAVAQNNQIIADQNAQAAEKQAEAEQAAGETQVTARQMETAQEQGRIRAAVGASGVDPNSGSPIELQSDTAKLGQLDAMTIRNNASRKAYGYEVQAWGDHAQGSTFNAQAALNNMAASNYGAAGGINASSSLLSGASSVASKWSMYQNKGVGTDTALLAG